MTTRQTHVAVVSKAAHSVSILPGQGAVGEDVTELPGHGATREQISMLHTRYGLAGELSAGKEVLELACGPGIGLGHLAKQARRVVGGDLDENNIAVARQRYGNRIEVAVIDAQKLPYEDNSFDVVLLLEAIYWLPNPDAFVSETKRVLRPDGIVFLSSANCERPDFHPSPYSTHYFSAVDLKQLLSTHGFAVELYGGFAVGGGGMRDRLLHFPQRYSHW